MNTDITQGIEDSGSDSEAPPEFQAADVSPSTQTMESRLHDTLLEGVSAEAITAHGGGNHGDGDHGGGDPEVAPPTEPGEADATAPEAAPADSAPTDPTPLVEDLTVVVDEAAESVPVAAEAVDTTVEAVAEVISVPAALADTYVAEESPATARFGAKSPPGFPPGLRTFPDFAKSPRIGQVMGELGEVNVTVLAYLRGEGTAALAHWQALAGAKTPADAIRLQVDEMQRAADASLSCFAALAKRAGRLPALIGRR